MYRRKPRRAPTRERERMSPIRFPWRTNTTASARAETVATPAARPSITSIRLKPFVITIIHRKVRATHRSGGNASMRIRIPDFIMRNTAVTWTSSLTRGESRPMSSISPSRTMMEHARSSPETLSLNCRNRETGKSTAAKTATPPR